MTKSGTFDEGWAYLSDAQRVAVLWGDGAALVTATPGSGKTHVLTMRIARLLRESAGQHFRILALTFTDKAAREMRARLEQYVPDMHQRAFVGTFHAFGSDIIRQHGSHLGIQPDFRIYGQEADQLDVLVDGARQIGFPIREKALLKKDLSAIKQLKSRLIAPDQINGYFDNPELKDRVANLYQAYENALREQNALDFDSLLYEAHRLLETYPVFRRHYTTVYSYVCVDEFQDTNEAQARVLEQLIHPQNPNVFIVADDNQLIYQWNGASPKRLESFCKDYHPHIIRLPTNYRCPQQIVNIANNLIRYNNPAQNMVAEEMISAKKIDDTAEVVRLIGPFADEKEEAKQLANDIINRHQDRFDSVVILARNNKLLKVANEAFVARHIPAILAQRKDDFVSPPFMWIVSALRLALNHQDGESLQQLNSAFQIMFSLEIDLPQITARAELDKNDYLVSWINEVAGMNGMLSEIAQQLFPALSHLVANLDYRAYIKKALVVFDSIFSEDHEYTDEKQVWNELVNGINQTDAHTLEEFLQKLDLHSKETPHKPNHVSLMTIAKSKGTEFAHVYLVGVVEDELPSYHAKTSGDEAMREERRNCYVAITRASESLTLSFAKSYFSWNKEPSRFLNEMKVSISIM